MEFDPLSLFTPAASVEEVTFVSPSSDGDRDRNRDRNRCDGDDPDGDDPDGDADQPLHVLDLPSLPCRPPNDVIVLFLKLFAPAQVHNFARGVVEARSIHEEFAARQCQANVDASLTWLAHNCPRFASTAALAAVPALAPALKRDPGYNAWLTAIVSSCADDEVLRLASLRLAENCGRTAQPQIVRKITLEGAQPLLLQEPSLTSDNLGLKTWGSSLVLSQRLVRGLRLHDPILELGAGTGLVGIVLARLGHDVTLTDLAPIVPNLAHNVALNNVAAAVEELDWSNPPACHRTYNTIVLSDPIYSSQHPHWVACMCHRYLSANPGASVLVQIPLRPKFEAERALLWQLLSERFTVVDEAIEAGRDDFGEMQFCFRHLHRI
ncbi:Protein-lysine N-methyltransferase EFM2 [[Candida] zeylanoides]